MMQGVLCKLKEVKVMIRTKPKMRLKTSRENASILERLDTRNVTTKMKQRMSHEAREKGTMILNETYFL